MIWLDNAATTMIKPRAVQHAVQSAMRQAAGYARGGHAAAMRAGELVYTARERAAALFGVDDPARVVFTQNATHALNLAIHALAEPKMRVVVSGYAHNAVMRPLSLRGITPRVLDTPLWQPEAMVAAAERELAAGAELFILTRVSNVFGYILPIEQIATLLDRAGVRLILDDAQGAGVLPLEVSRHPCLAAVGMAGHKGLYGPQGTGILLALDDKIAQRPLLAGGTGSLSESLSPPDFLPDALECGTPNVPGIAGLSAGLAFVQAVGEEQILQHERKMKDRLLRALAEAKGLQCHADPTGRHQNGVLSISFSDISVERAAERLAEAGIATRAGLHCAPLAHRTAGTEQGGTLRLSPSFFTLPHQVDRAAEVLTAL